MGSYYRHTILTRRYSADDVLISPGPAWWVVYDQIIPAHSTIDVSDPPSVDDIAIPNTLNGMWVDQEDTFFDASDVLLEERSMTLELETDPATSGSGLSEEEISKHLHVYIAQGKMIENGDICSICLGEYEKEDKMGRLECGHRYHAECIKPWLLSNNVCPLCRSTALTL